MHPVVTVIILGEVISDLTSGGVAFTILSSSLVFDGDFFFFFFANAWDQIEEVLVF